MQINKFIARLIESEVSGEAAPITWAGRLGRYIRPNYGEFWKNTKNSSIRRIKKSNICAWCVWYDHRWNVKSDIIVVKE